MRPHLPKNAWDMEYVRCYVIPFVINVKKIVSWDVPILEVHRSTCSPHYRHLKATVTDTAKKRLAPVVQYELRSSKGTRK